MRFYVVLLLLYIVLLADGHNVLSRTVLRAKRDAVGALRIINNHASPIHEDVKLEGETAPDKVVPPKDAVWFEGQSLRKSLPLSNRLDLVRSISRFITLFVLLISGIVEFYPMIQQLYQCVQSFVLV
ncbi:hypothetical protein evm_005428 [Chilo suppressalis]|nr:hypothetical protein evm_005428 [Chilo suppressalis]